MPETPASAGAFVVALDVTRPGAASQSAVLLTLLYRGGLPRGLARGGSRSDEALYRVGPAVSCGDSSIAGLTAEGGYAPRFASR